MCSRCQSKFSGRRHERQSALATYPPSRLSLIFLIGLLLAQALSFGAQYYERYQSAKNTMLGNLETDVSTSIAILDRLPAEERPAWLERLARKTMATC